MHNSAKPRILFCLLTALLLLSAGGLSAMDTRNFGRGSTTKVTYYWSNYEETVLPGGTAQRLHYLPGGSVMVETVQQETGAGAGSGNTTGTKVLYYGYQDHLGSLTALVRERINGNGNGNGSISRTVADYRSYDAWGRLRDNDDWTLPRTTDLQITDRGYTGHEHLQSFDIINMNGRVYDPLTAQFFSPDPYVQAPDSWLNYNRYAYCLDNPLIYTDPDGEFWWIPVLIGSSGFATGFITGFANRMIQGHSIKGSLKTGLIDGLIGGTGGALIGGTLSGINAYNDGRSFWDGAYELKYVANDPKLSSSELASLVEGDYTTMDCVKFSNRASFGQDLSPTADLYSFQELQGEGISFDQLKKYHDLGYNRAHASVNDYYNSSTREREFHRMAIKVVRYKPWKNYLAVKVYDSGSLFFKVENGIIDGASRTSIDYIKTYNLLRTKVFKLNKILLWAPR